MPWRFLPRLMWQSELDRLTKRAEAGDQLGVHIDGLIDQARRKGGCNFVGKLERFSRMHKAQAAGDNERLAVVLNEARLCPGK